MTRTVCFGPVNSRQQILDLMSRQQHFCVIKRVQKRGCSKLDGEMNKSRLAGKRSLRTQNDQIKSPVGSLK